MKIYFGLITNPDELDMFGTSGLLEFEGEYFSGAVEFGTNPGGLEDVTISDGCGRSIPISVNYLEQLNTVLREMRKIHEEISEADRLREEVESGDLNGSICQYGHIHY